MGSGEHVMKGLLIAGVATSVFTFATGAASAALIIDDFTNVNTSGTVSVPGGNPGPGNLTETGLSGVLGGSRGITINRTLNQSNTVSGTVNTGAGRIEFLTASNQDAADFILDYVMDSVDLTGGGANNAFGLTFDFASFPTTT